MWISGTQCETYDVKMKNICHPSKSLEKIRHSGQRNPWPLPKYALAYTYNKYYTFYNVYVRRVQRAYLAGNLVRRKTCSEQSSRGRH